VKSVQILSELKASAPIPSSNKVVLKEGDIYHALIKERKPGNEAVLQIRGNNVNVKFEGEVPSGNRAAIQVAKADGQPPTVNALPQTPGQASAKAELSVVFQRWNGGIPLSDGLKSAVETVLQKGVPLNKESFQHIKTFMETAGGRIQDKLETLSLMAKKNLDFTPVQLKSVHQALHSRDYAGSLQQVFSEADPDFIHKLVDSQSKVKAASERPTITNEVVTPAQSSRRSLQLTELIGKMKENGSQQALVERTEQMRDLSVKLVLENMSALQKSLKLSDQQVEQIQAGLKQGKSIESLIRIISAGKDVSALPPNIQQAVKLEKTAVMLLENEWNKLSGKVGNIGQQLMEALKAVRKEPSFDQMIQKLIPLSQQLPEGQRQAFTNAIQQAAALEANGKEMAARKEIGDALANIQSETSASAAKTSQEPAQEVYKLNQEILSHIPIQSKNILVERVTKKLSQIAMDFKNFKNDVSKNLQTIQQLIQQHQSKAHITAKPLLETTIKNLDQAILRSDFMLYADMKTEKKLLTASTQLAEAKKLLSKGEHSQAHRLVSEVKTMLEKMMFKPSDVRMKHYVSQELGRLESQSLPKQVSQAFDQSLSTLRQEPSARSAYEYVRQLGLSNEADQAQQLVSRNRTQEGLAPNVKDLLLKMAKNESDMIQSAKADQALTNLTGQQLISKNDSSGLQQLMFSLPYLLQDKLDNVKVFVNSKNDREKIDWENCSLFFLFETRKLGEVGIALSSSDRNLTIKVKNDSEGFKEKMEPLAKLAVSRLEAIGYTISSIQFDALNKEQPDEVPTQPVYDKNQPALTEKGYDFSV
jgi:uncharacterized protein